MLQSLYYKNFNNKNINQSYCGLKIFVTSRKLDKERDLGSNLYDTNVWILCVISVSSAA